MQRILTWIALVVVICAMGFGTGCINKTKTVYIRSGDIVRLRSDVPNVPIWVQVPGGEWEPSTLTLQEGWYVGSIDPK